MAESQSDEAVRAQLHEAYMELAERENDLRLSAELGKALVEANAALQAQFDAAAAEHLSAVERLEYENHAMRVKLDVAIRHSTALEADRDHDANVQLDKLHREQARCEERVREEAREKLKVFSELDTLRSELLRERDIRILAEGKISRLESTILDLREQSRYASAIHDDNNVEEQDSLMRRQRTAERISELEECLATSQDEARKFKAALTDAEQRLAQALTDTHQAKQDVREMAELLNTANSRISDYEIEVDELRIQCSSGNGVGGVSLLSEIEDRRVALEQELLTVQLRFESAQRALTQSRARERQLRARVVMSLQCSGGGAAESGRVARLEAALSQSRADAQRLLAQLRQSERQLAESERKIHEKYASFGGEGDSAAYNDYLRTECESFRTELQAARDELRTKCFIQASESDKLRAVEGRLYRTETQLQRAVADTGRFRLRVDELEQQLSALEVVQQDQLQQLQQLQQEKAQQLAQSQQQRQQAKQPVVKVKASPSSPSKENAPAVNVENDPSITAKPPSVEPAVIVTTSNPESNTVTASQPSIAKLHPTAKVITVKSENAHKNSECAQQ